MLANVFLVGAAKCATTDIANSLSLRCNDVYVPYMKEPHYFSELNVPLKKKAFFPFVEKFESYENLYSGSLCRIKIDASTSYLWANGCAAKRIFNYSPDAKVIICLRNPIDRAHSHYLNDVREGHQNGEFSELIRVGFSEYEWGGDGCYIQCSLYSRAVSEYFSVFGKENVKVVFFDDYVSDKVQVLNDVASFLSVSLDEQIVGPDVKNSFGMPRNKFFKLALSSNFLRSTYRFVTPAAVKTTIRDKFLFKKIDKPCISEKDFLFLRDLFFDDTRSLEALLERKLPSGWM